MRSSRVITLFHPPPPSRRGPSSIMVSVMVHGVAFIWLYLGLGRMPRVDEASPIRRYSVRVVRQDDIEYPAKRVELPAALAQSSARSVVQPVAHSVSHSVADVAPIAHAMMRTPGPALPPAPAPVPTRVPAPAPAPPPAPVAAAAPAPPPPPDLKQILSKTHTLIQPDVPPEVKLQEIVPLPVIVKWTPDSSRNKLIITPPPLPTTSALAKPTIKLPNRELKPADVKISSTPFKSKVPTLPPSTTSPIVVRRQEPVTHVPETASKASEPSAPAQVVSLSDMQSKQAVVPIPAANSVAHPVPSNTMAPGHSENATAAAGNGNTPNKADISKADNGKADNGSASSKTGNGNPSSKSTAGAGQSPQGQGPAGSSAQGNTAQADKAEKANPGDAATGGALVAHHDANPVPGAGTAPPAAVAGSSGETYGTRFTQPKDGQFGVVVVGSSLAEQYPETVGLWSGRLIYTVYLHVGPGKSWILQYSLPRDATPAVAGAITRPDAPWPFDMVRPHLDPGDFNSDAIMVHGFVNPTGRFERLAIVFPTEFEKSKLVLKALEQWQFRPARQNGQIAAVEVLLIIPEETE